MNKGSPQVGWRADQPSLDRLAGQEHGSGSAVVGPVRGVLLERAPELGEEQDHDSLVQPVRFQAGQESGDRLRNPAEQVLVRVPLAGMGVEAIVSRVVRVWETSRVCPICSSVRFGKAVLTEEIKVESLEVDQVPDDRLDMVPKPGGRPEDLWGAF